MPFLETEYRAAEEHTVWREDVGDVPDRHGLVRLRPPQAVQHVVQRRRVERTLDRQRLHHVRLDGHRVHRREPVRRLPEHVRVRIEQGDLGPVGRCRLLQEVCPGRRPGRRPHEPAIALHPGGIGTFQTARAMKPSTPRVVDREEEPGCSRAVPQTMAPHPSPSSSSRRRASARIEPIVSQRRGAEPLLRAEQAPEEGPSAMQGEAKASSTSHRPVASRLPKSPSGHGTTIPARRSPCSRARRPPWTAPAPSKNRAWILVPSTPVPGNFFFGEERPASVPLSGSSRTSSAVACRDMSPSSSWWWSAPPPSFACPSVPSAEVVRPRSQWSLKKCTFEVRGKRFPRRIRAGYAPPAMEARRRCGSVPAALLLAAVILSACTLRLPVRRTRRRRYPRSPDGHDESRSCEPPSRRGTGYPRRSRTGPSGSVPGCPSRSINVFARWSRSGAGSRRHCGTTIRAASSPSSGRPQRRRFDVREAGTTTTTIVVGDEGLVCVRGEPSCRTRTGRCDPR